jgi:hypothetical protein
LRSASVGSTQRRRAAVTPQPRLKVPPDEPGCHTIRVRVLVAHCTPASVPPGNRQKVCENWEGDEPMKRMTAALLFGTVMAFAPGVVRGEPIEKKGTTPYVTHFIFRPLMSIDIPNLGKATTLEAVGTTQNMKGAGRPAGRHSARGLLSRLAGVTAKPGEARRARDQSIAHKGSPDDLSAIAP